MVGAPSTPNLQTTERGTTMAIHYVLYENHLTPDPTDYAARVKTLDTVDLPLIVEDCYELGEEFPHIYGPIPIGAVTAVMPFPPSEDGSFQLPDGLST